MTSFAELFDRAHYQKLSASLAQHNVTLAPERLEADIAPILKDFDGGRTIGNSVGAAVPKLGHWLIAFIQNIVDFFRGKSSKPDAKFNDVIDATSQKTALFERDEATSRIYLRMQAKYGTEVAKMVSGMSDNGDPINIEGNVFGELSASIGAPPGASSSLARASRG